jgi:hypothetical protein
MINYIMRITDQKSRRDGIMVGKCHESEPESRRDGIIVIAVSKI